MFPCVILTTLFIVPFAVGETENVCAGKEFRLPVYSTSRTVTFTPDSGEPKRVLLENIAVKDPRFKLTKDRMLVLREVTGSDQGLYSIKLLSGFTYETLRLKVLDCIASYQRYYGESFKQNIPEDASLLEFSPLGAPAEAVPVVLGNWDDPEASSPGRGRLEQGGKVWVVEGVSQADQGDYTVRGANGNVLSQSRLAVRAHSFNFTRFVKESMNLPLPVPRGSLKFTPQKYVEDPTLNQSDPRPHQGPAQLINEGKILNTDLRYRGLISFRGNGSDKEVVIESLNLGHRGLYEIRDEQGNLVSSTVLEVFEKETPWRTVLAVISGCGGAILSMTTLILVLRRYPCCSFSQLTASCRRKQKPPVNAPGVNRQDERPESAQPSDAQQPGSARKCTPGSSPTRTGYIPVTVDTPTFQNQKLNRLAASHSPGRNDASNDEEKTISFIVPGPSDCLHSSEDCVQFSFKKDIGKEQQGQAHDCFSAFPLEMKVPEPSSVYTSGKMNIS